MTAPDPRRRREDQRAASRDDRNVPETTGGADAVDKTTYTAPSGSEPADTAGTSPYKTARVSSGGFGPLAWAAIALAVVVLLIYGLGFFR